jgi:hypothetical protein
MSRAVPAHEQRPILHTNALILAAASLLDQVQAA